MRNRFTTGAKEAISFSAEEAMRTNSPAISAAHLLLGLLRVDDAAIGDWRKQVRLPELTAAIEAIIRSTVEGHPASRKRSLPLDREAERIIRHSIKEAAGQRDIEPIHLLLSIIHDTKGSLATLKTFFPGA